MELKKILKKNLFTIITLSISFVVLMVFLFTTDGVATLGRILQTLRAEWLGLAVVCAVGYWILEGYSQNLFCRNVQPDWTFGRSFSVGMTGLLYSALTPFSTGGQPMQIYAMKKMGMDTGKAASVIAMKTVVFQVVMVLYSLVAVAAKLSFFQRNISDFSFVTVIGLLSNSLFIATILLFIFSEKATNKILRFCLGLLFKIKLCKHPVRRYKKMRRQFLLFHNSAKLMGRSFKLYFSTIVLTVIQLTITSLVPYFIYLSFGLEPSAVDVFTMVTAQVFVSMISAFVPLPGASGGAEASFLLFFGSFFGNTIVPAILLWRIISYYFNIVFGGIFYWWGSKRFYTQAEPVANSGPH